MNIELYLFLPLYEEDKGVRFHLFQDWNLAFFSSDFRVSEDARTNNTAMRRDYLMNVFPMVISVYLLVTRDVNR
jgi:hypothetical protein